MRPLLDLGDGLLDTLDGQPTSGRKQSDESAPGTPIGGLQPWPLTEESRKEPTSVDARIVRVRHHRLLLGELSGKVCGRRSERDRRSSHQRAVASSLGVELLNRLQPGPPPRHSAEYRASLIADIGRVLRLARKRSRQLVLLQGAVPVTKMISWAA